MAYPIPSWAYSIFDAYGLPWPDIDEDDFETMRQPLRNFGTDLRAVGDAIGTALSDLLAGNPSDTLRAVDTYFGDVRSKFLDPIGDLCQDLAAQDGPCVIGYNAVLDVKRGLVVMLGADVTNTIVDGIATVVTLGADSALTLAEQAGMRELISEAVKSGISYVSGELASAATRIIDNFVASIVQPFINQVEGDVGRAIDSYMPEFVLRDISSDDGLAGRLHLSPEQLDTCLASLISSSDHLAQATSKLDSILESLFNAPAPGTPSGGSSAMREVVKGIVATIESELVTAINRLTQQVESHFVDILQNYARALEDLDQQARNIASNVKAARGADVMFLAVAGVATAAAARVSTTPGVVNAEEADSVQVGTASMLDETPDLVVAVDVSSVGAGAAEAVVEVEELQLPVATANVMVGSVASNGGSVADLTTAKATDVMIGSAGPNTGSVADLTTVQPTTTPHVVPVSGVEHTASTLKTGHEQQRQRVDASAGSGNSAANVDRLSGRREDDGVRGPQRVDSSAVNVHEIETPTTDDKRPVIDTSTVEVDEEA